jgi:hypothetical protein
MWNPRLNLDDGVYAVPGFFIRAADGSRVLLDTGPVQKFDGSQSRFKATMAVSMPLNS